MKDRNEILSEYLLGEGSEQERARLEREIAQDAELAAEAAELSPIVASLAALPEEAWDAPEPPPLRLGGAPDAPRSHDAAPESPRKERDGFFRRFFSGSLSMRPAYALASVLLVFVGGLAVGLFSQGDNSADPLGPSVQQASLAPVSSIDPRAAGSADVKHDGKVIRLKLSGLAKNSEDDFYEAWLMDPKNGLVAIGTFKVGEDGAATLDLPVPVGTDRFPVVDISLQPADGKPTHSGVSVLRGKLQS